MKSEKEWEGEPAGLVCTTEAPLLTVGFGFPGLGVPGKVSEVKSQESGEAKGYCIW